MCILVFIYKNKDKIMTKICIFFAHFGLNIRHSFLYFVTLKGFVFIIGSILAALLRQNSKTNMTKNRD